MLMVILSERLPIGERCQKQLYHPVNCDMYFQVCKAEVARSQDHIDCLVEDLGAHNS